MPLAVYLKPRFKTWFVVFAFLGCSSAGAQDWSTVSSQVFTNNGVVNCIECHSTTKTDATLNATGLASRHSAPVGVNFDNAGLFDLTAYSNATGEAVVYGSSTEAIQGVSYGFVGGIINRIYEWAAHFTSTGYMPMNPIDGADFTDHTNLADAKKAVLMHWALQGAPYAAPVASTGSASGISKIGATLNAAITPNIHSGSAVSGTAYFEYGETITYGTQTTAITGLLGTSGVAQATVISGLSCGTLYHFRAVATNGQMNTVAITYGFTTYTENGIADVTGSDQTFTTTACTAPVISEGAAISPAAINEDSDTTFSLNVSDDDPGTLTWSVQTQGSLGAFSFDTSTIGSPVTVRYTATANLNGSDTAGRIRITNAATGLSDTITPNMTVTSINDQPAITSTASTSAIEGSLYSYLVVVDDPDDSYAVGLSILLTNQPLGMSVDSGTGLITWMPVNGDTTSGLVTVTVTDGGEDSTVAAVQQFTIAVTPTNDPPVITPGATTTATEDVLYSYQMQLTDVDDANNGTDINFTLSNQPVGMSVSNTGLITWTPSEGVLTSGAVTMTVEDGNEDLSPPTIANNGQENFTIAVTAVNDSPTITSTAPTAAAESVSYSYPVTANDVDDTAGFGMAANQLNISLSNEPAGMVVDTTTGVITWTPARTGAAQTHTVTVTVQDGLEDGAVTSQETFTVSVSIDDIDGDLVAVYSDNCPSISNIAQGDNDNDTVYVGNAGFPAIGDVDQSDPLTGGDVCDSDDDNDGISDTDEAMFPGCLDPFNAADATQDCDGDGINNITEVNDGDPGTDPVTDSVGPTVTAPVDITVDATGLLTAVDIGTATGSDGNDGEVTIFKVALDLTAAEITALENPMTGCGAFATYQSDIKALRPGAHKVTWASCDSKGNTGHDEQTVNVKPLVSMSAGQSVGEGQAINVLVVLNGDAIAYPAMVSYVMTGTATAGADYDGVSGTVTFNAPGEVAVISFNTLADALVEADEIIDILLHTPINIALGDANRHTVTITEADIAPQVALHVSQTVTLGNKVYQPDGTVTVVANANDGNGDTLTFDWSGSDQTLLNALGTTISSNQLSFNPAAATLVLDDFYNVKIMVSDGNTNISVERLLQLSGAPAALNPDDSDGDGNNDDSVAEGYGDIDGDGIPNYLDHASTPANAIENHTANLQTSLLIETDPGLVITLGQTAVAAEASGLQVGLQDIKDYGGSGGSAVSNADTDYTFLSSLLSFEISGLTDAIESVHVVVPLTSAIQANSTYRKYNATGWFDFVIDDRNELRSAPGGSGVCPQPGSNLYATGLTVGHLCLQLTVQDGGVNDADGVRNYIVKDSGALALTPEVVDVTESNDSGRVGSVNLWFMSILLIMAMVIWLLRVKQMAREKHR